MTTIDIRAINRQEHIRSNIKQTCCREVAVWCNVFHLLHTKWMWSKTNVFRRHPGDAVRFPLCSCILHQKMNLRSTRQIGINFMSLELKLRLDFGFCVARSCKSGDLRTWYSWESYRDVAVKVFTSPSTDHICQQGLYSTVAYTHKYSMKLRGRKIGQKVGLCSWNWSIDLWDACQGYDPGI